MTIRYKLTALGKFIYSILIHNLMRPVSFLRLHEEYKKQAKTAKSKKKLSENSVKANKKCKNCSTFNLFEHLDSSC